MSENDEVRRNVDGCDDSEGDFVGALGGRPRTAVVEIALASVSLDSLCVLAPS